MVAVFTELFLTRPQTKYGQVYGKCNSEVFLQAKHNEKPSYLISSCNHLYTNLL